MCCGKNRTRFMTALTESTTKPANNVVVPKPPLSISFVYIGNASMTVKGPITGFDYRFERPGARVEVDWRDRILLASIRQLRQIK